MNQNATYVRHCETFNFVAFRGCFRERGGGSEGLIKAFLSLFRVGPHAPCTRQLLLKSGIVVACRICDPVDLNESPSCTIGINHEFHQERLFSGFQQVAGI